jgi:hypothetical protein
VISRFKCFFAVGLFCFGAVAAHANSMSFNGYIQTSGRTGVDFNNLSASGSVRIMINSNGQINYRYQVGDQIFDSNPEAAIPDLAGSNNASWQDNGRAIGDAGYSNNDRPAPVWTISFSGAPYLLIPDAPATANTKANGAADTSTLNPGEPVRYAGPVDGGNWNYSASNFATSNFDIASIKPANLVVPDTSFVALARDPVYSWDTPFYGFAEEAPEPATFVLMFGALLVGGIAVRVQRRTKSVS